VREWWWEESEAEELALGREPSRAWGDASALARLVPSNLSHSPLERIVCMLATLSDWLRRREAADAERAQLSDPPGLLSNRSRAHSCARSELSLAADLERACTGTSLQSVVEGARRGYALICSRYFCRNGFESVDSLLSCGTHLGSSCRAKTVSASVRYDAHRPRQGRRLRRAREESRDAPGRGAWRG